MDWNERVVDLIFGILIATFGLMGAAVAVVDQMYGLTIFGIVILAIGSLIIYKGVKG